MIEAIVEKEIYLLKEFNDARLNETFAENRIKKFHQRAELSRSTEMKNEMKKEFNEMKKKIDEKLTHLKELISKK